MRLRSAAIELLGFLIFAALGLPVTAGAEDSGHTGTDTLVMFVGEDVEVLSIASRRQESAWKAPAVAEVITREEMWERGVRTVSQALGMSAGFYMARKEWGSEGYLRGIPDSTLLLYDTVALGSDATKSLQLLDHQLSLAPVKRIEVVRGPGSVLWGPDAFAGIVNVTPMSGKDLDGVETGVLYGGPGDQGAVYINMGKDAGDWDAFLSLSGRSGEEDDTPCNIVRFWEDGKRACPYEDRFGRKTPERSRYIEASGRFSFRDWFTASGLISDYKKPYAMTGPTTETNPEKLTWPEERSGPFGYLKLEAKKDLDHASALRFMGTCSWINTDYGIIGRTLEQKEEAFYGELIYDRSFFAGKGLFTGGMSFRKKDIRNAPVWQSYFPDYVAQKKTVFLPICSLEDYDDRLRSLFGQYTHKIGDVNLLLGMRSDNHDQYKDAVSYNAGAVWIPGKEWMVKALYGTAYRTPFARQLLGQEKPELEKIQTLNLQAAWKPSQTGELGLCGFFSRLKNHLMEDVYAGLSRPNKQRIYGVEATGRISILKSLELSANLTLLNNSGPDETYRYVKYWTPEPVYEELRFPYDTGPKRLFNLMGTWRPVERVSLFARLGYHSSAQLIYPRADRFSSVPGAWLLDLTATVRDIGLPGLDLRIAIRNLTDKHYDMPGTYTTIPGEPFSAEVALRKRW